ncbi:hypothetical protein GUJ93_ZPchr0006g40723 [Zizania palustris]|uniref:Uncharacterized protein n=1 Tax=Zizania palustris TaxID=103762 RepID=A0A8J5VJW6_ZIZPA|nr:hypothetical protein GUJ93_ZPchr0006g40723 [Zizania palustris]
MEQEALLAHSSFLGGDDDGEVSNTPPTKEDTFTMCTLPFTQSQSPVPTVVPRTTLGCSSSKDGQDDEMSGITKQRCRPRVCTRKVRRARIKIPSPSPRRTTSEVQHNNGDPLCKAVLMIPTKDCPPAVPVDWLALARKRGLF